MPKVTQTGFVSKEQEEYLRVNNPELYKYVLNKFGTYGKPKAVVPTPHNNLVTIRKISKE